MYNPPHPGEFITEVYLEPNEITGRELATALGVAPSTLHRVLNGLSGISPAMACGSPKHWGALPKAGL